MARAERPVVEVARDEVEGVALVRHEPSPRNGGATLVFVHGGCHGAWAWEGMQQWFAERGWGSIALDWYSHGASRRLPEQEWLRRGIADVEQEIALACGAVGGPCVVIGHSMGGLAAQVYASRRPSSLAGLVLLAPVVPHGFADAPVDVPHDHDVPWGPPPPEMARHLFYSGVDDATAAQHYARLQAESPQAVHEATRWSVEVDVGAIEVPTLTIAAEHDALVPAAYVRALADGLGATHLEIPDAGHGVQLDPGWPALAEQVRDWLTRVADPTTQL